MFFTEVITITARWTALFTFLTAANLCTAHKENEHGEETTSTEYTITIIRIINMTVKQTRRSHPASRKLYHSSPESHAPQQQPRSSPYPPELVLLIRNELSNLAV